MRKTLAIVCMIVLIVSSAGCSRSKTLDLSSYNITVTDFAVRLLQTTYNENENVLISPISVLSGVTQNENNMDSNAVDQVEKTLGMKLEELDKFIYVYTNYLSKISNRKTKAYIEESETNQANSLEFEGVWDHGFGGSKNKMFDRVDYSLEGIDINGFVKFFDKERYALAVLLPNENMDISTYITGLTGEKIYRILSNPVEKEADVMIPKVSFSYEANLKNIFMDMGKTGVLAWNTEELTDFCEPVDDENIEFDNFFCTSSIVMTNNGINTERVAQLPPDTLTYEPPNIVYADRPFIIIIMDCKYNIPLLIGAIVDI